MMRMCLHRRVGYGVLVFALMCMGSTVAFADSILCGIQTGEWIPCEVCPPEVSCVCLYTGMICPDRKRTCNTYPFIDTSTPIYVIVSGTTYCYLERGCRSKDGGTCSLANPFNPCVVFSVNYAYGDMTTYYEDILCE